MTAAMARRWGPTPRAGESAPFGTAKVCVQGEWPRDRHMKENYLEVEKGPAFGTATLEDIKIDKLDGKTSFSATLVLHGERRLITGSATLERRNGGYSVQAEFPVKVSHYNRSI